ncbi:unnamed protein product [Heligmosomoides polygyrus]|uniref:Reverse transcriptase domain-containing protein n=1 Tax=Heligmosomoides polygyrus TaxID=6339 RepID=A0A183GP73_HELPZ|nr:unnamed protein product [Heligmosomoides polygyrus]
MDQISNLRFADDIVLISTSTAEVEEMLNELNVAESGVCLTGCKQPEIERSGRVVVPAEKEKTSNRQKDHQCIKV